MTLQEIAEFAKKHKACRDQYKPFVKAIKTDETLAWQIVRGSYEWLIGEGLDLDLAEVERLAKGVGVYYYSNGQPLSRPNYKDGALMEEV